MTDEELREVLATELDKRPKLRDFAAILRAGDNTSLLECALSGMHRIAVQVQEQIAQWMITHSYATGHGDTIEDLLSELIGQVRAETVEESAKVADRHTDPLFSDAYRIAADDIAKRIRGLLNKDGAT